MWCLQGRVVKCLELIQDSSSMRGMCTASTTTTATDTVTMVNSTSVVNGLAPHSPIGVLEAACLSYKSDETTVGSCPSSSHSSPVTKRRKLDKTTYGGDSWSHENMWNLDSHIKSQVVGEWDFWCVEIKRREKKRKKETLKIREVEKWKRRRWHALSMKKVILAAVI